MGTRIVHVSDISGREGTQDELGRLVIRQHPDFQQLPVTLDVLPEEIKTLEAATQLVVLEYFAPGSRRGERLTVTLEDFNRLAPDGVEMKAVVFQALIDQQAQRGAVKADPEPGTPAQGRARRAKADYATLEHAGEPHRGRMTETEKRLVREHLDEVNQRLRDQGLRQIDPADHAMKNRYGL
ncbi:MAG TPA: hypothetical protein VFA46_08060 [Actinomycetes bacterium]|jgi:hypothetical protein|nr:hypothetical protein [Actinomycetes bacterium]